MRAGVPGHQVAERVGDRLGERAGHPGRQRHPERVTQPAGVLDRRPALLARDPDLDQPAPCGQLGEPARRGRRVGAPLLHLHRRQRADRPDQVCDPLEVTAGAARREALQVAFCILDDLRVEQLPRVRLP